MTSKKRPLSPHIQIYRPQLTSLLSITHRGTGVVLAIGSLLLAYWLAAAATGPASYAKANAILGSKLGLVCLFGWTWALYYHLCNGIRHLFWDAGQGFQIDTVYASGRVVVIVSSVATVVTWLFAI